MCGFVGGVAPGDYLDEATIRAMTRALTHRGPDDEGYWRDSGSGVSLGFRRLAIQDLSTAGHQPMVSHSGRTAVVFNGEIYNKNELLGLVGVDVELRGHSDTEVLVEAIDAVGCDEVLPRLRGMFAFAAFDQESRDLWLARDKIGIKPLYIRDDGDGLLFASELRAILVHPGVSRVGRLSAAFDFLAHLYVRGEDSIVQGVTRLPPGSCRRYSVRENGRATFLDQREYWSLDKVRSAARSRPFTSAPQVKSELKSALRESVAIRMVADVPVGAFLSGGIDSSLITAVMQEHEQERIKTFTIGFDVERYDEARKAEHVAAALGTDHTTVQFEVKDALDLVPALPGLSDEPMANPSFLPTLLLSSVARRDVVVALSGDGGDELFGGYNRYLFGPDVIRCLSALPAHVRTLASRRLSSLAKGSLVRRLERQRHGRTAGQHTVGDRLTRIAQLLRASSSDAAYEALLSVGMVDPPTSLRRQLQDERTSQFELSAGMMMALDQRAYLPDDLLTKVDRASMRHSLEARVPLLDEKLVELSWRIPPQFKIREGKTKWPLRALLADYLPQEMIDLPKMGFTVPIKSWMSSELREWARDTLCTGSTRFPWDDTGMQQTFERFDEGDESLALPLWAAATLEAWSQHWEVSFDT